MLIIFEGINGIGKSTVAERLSKQYNIPIYKTFGKDRESLPKGKNTGKLIEIFQQGIGDLFAIDTIRQSLSTMILDRCSISAYAYNQGEDSREIAKQWWELCPKDCKIFFLYSSDVDTIDSRAKKETVFKRNMDPKNIQNRYFELFDALDGIERNLIKICVDGLDRNEVYSIVRKELEFNEK
jgi:thymidylate kinase